MMRSGTAFSCSWLRFTLYEELKARSFSHRGDVDDRMLSEAMLPLLESLAELVDVRPALHKRFGMPQ